MKSNSTLHTPYIATAAKPANSAISVCGLSNPAIFPLNVLTSQTATSAGKLTFSAKSAAIVKTDAQASTTCFGMGNLQDNSIIYLATGLDISNGIDGLLTNRNSIPVNTDWELAIEAANTELLKENALGKTYPNLLGTCAKNENAIASTDFDLTGMTVKTFWKQTKSGSQTKVNTVSSGAFFTASANRLFAATQKAEKTARFLKAHKF